MRKLLSFLKKNLQVNWQRLTVLTIQSLVLLAVLWGMDAAFGRPFDSSVQFVIGNCVGFACGWDLARETRV